MKLGDIKIEALKLMFVNMGDDIDIESLETYAQDEIYKSYLVNMPGAINRCFASIEEKRVLPSKSRTLQRSEALASGGFVRFDIASLISDFFDIDRIVRETSDGDYEGDCDYTTEGDTLVLDRYEEEDGVTYTVLYKPTIERITSSTDDNTEIAIPNNIAAYIPYFLKGDLYRDDEPNEASEARNWYEQAMNEIYLKKEHKTNRIKSVYSQTE